MINMYMRFMFIILVSLVLGTNYASAVESNPADNVVVAETVYEITLEIVEGTTLEDVNAFWGLNLQELYLQRLSSLLLKPKVLVVLHRVWY